MSATREVTLDQGTIRYRDTGGTGDPIVFIHGALVNGRLWEEVVPRLEGRYRCIVPDLPLGSHVIPMRRDADLTPPGLASLIAEFMAALDLNGVTLVANDTGGAISQLVAVNHPERLARLVLTPCDAYENFLPPAFRYLQLIGRVPGGVFLTAQSMRLRATRRMPLAYGWLTKKRLSN
jgi:pimeloyl-ACP methyl ester carboxylesterase